MIALPHTLSRLKFGLMRGLPVLLMPLWIGAILVSMGRLWAYEHTAAHVEVSPTRWPVSTYLRHPSVGSTLVMVAHPCCPCTSASISELARIMAHPPRPVAAYVLFYRPHVLPREWQKTDLYARAAAIPGVTALWDEDGKEAGRFQATTSGQTLLFDAGGRLMYRGGITSARGMEGDNSGEEALLALLQGRSAPRTRFPVFGCSLLSPGDSKWQYAVMVKSGGKMREVMGDANTGKIASEEIVTAKEEAAEKRAEEAAKKAGGPPGLPGSSPFLRIVPGNLRGAALHDGSCRDNGSPVQAFLSH